MVPVPVPPPNPCCCGACLLAGDDYNRANNTDINANNSPILYVIDVGTFEIVSSNLESTAATAGFTVAAFGTEPTYARTYNLIFSFSSTAAVLTVTVGDHEIELDLATASLRVYDTVAAEYIWQRETVPYVANTSCTLTLQVGPIYYDNTGGHRFLQHGIKIILSGVTFTVALPVECNGDGSISVLKVGAATFKMTSFYIYQNELVGTFATANCLTPATGNDCSSITTGYTKPLEWEFPTGTWSGLSCSAAGMARFIGQIGRHNSERVAFKVPVDNRVVLGIGHQIYELPNVGEFVTLYLDEPSQTGVKIEKTADYPAGTDEYDITVLVNGSAVEVRTIGASGGITLDTAWELFSTNDGEFVVARSNPDLSPAAHPAVKSFTWSSKPTMFIPAIEDSSSGAARVYTMPGGTRFATGPFLPCTRYLSQSVNGSIGCTSPGSGFDVTLAGISGTCGDASDAAAEMNATFRVSAVNNFLSGSLDSCGVKTFYCVTLASDWNFSTSAYQTNPTARTLQVHAQFKNAWALFETTYSSAPACNTLSGTSFALIDYHNDDGIDMSAATCEVDYVA